MRWQLLIWLLLWIPVGAQELILKNDGTPVATFSLAELRQKFPDQSVTVLDRHDGKQRTYQAIRLPDLLKAVYGDSLKGESDLMFVCDDGYASNVNVQDVLRYEGWLAYGFADGSSFKTDHELGPFALVWDTRKFPRQKVLGSVPYQVSSLDLVDFGKRFARVLPPAGSKPDVQRGFEAFRHTCLSCHKMNGQGGDRGVDLNYPVSVTKYISEPYLTAIIDNPAKVRGNTIMPGLLPNYPDRARVIKDIVAYLKAMAAKRKK